MKNFSKNNYSKKSNDTDNRRSQSKNNYKSHSFQEDRFNSSKGNTYERNKKKEMILIEEIILKGETI